MSGLHTLLGPAAHVGSERLPDYYQPFANTVNNTPIDTLPGWFWATADGLPHNTSNRQVGMLSGLPGADGSPGFAFNSSADTATRGNVAWYAGHPEPLRIQREEIRGFELDIGHASTTSQTRFLIRIDHAGIDRWFVTRETWSNATAVENAEQFQALARWIEADFSTLTWRPLLNGTAEFDGLNGANSSGFTIITNSTNPSAVTLPAGDITAVGVYHWNSATGTTRFDSFRILFNGPAPIPSLGLSELLPDAATLPTGPVNPMSPAAPALTLPTGPVNPMAPQSSFSVPGRPSLSLNQIFSTPQQTSGDPPVVPDPINPTPIQT